MPWTSLDRVGGQAFAQALDGGNAAGDSRFQGQTDALAFRRASSLP